MAEPVVVVPYDPAWPHRFETLRSKIALALGALAARIEHVGSTAIEGMCAKPTIDVTVELRRAADLSDAIEKLSALGYVHEGDRGVTGREAFATPPGAPAHDHHLYVCPPGHEQLGAQLAFRNYLRTHPQAATEYAALKQALAVAYRNDRAAYTDGKTAFVRAILARVQPG